MNNNMRITILSSCHLCLSVIATMRDLKKKDKLVEAAGDTFGKTLVLLPLDVCSDESVKQCINNVKDRHIDILSESETLPLFDPGRAQKTYSLYNLIYRSNMMQNDKI